MDRAAAALVFLALFVTQVAAQECKLTLLGTGDVAVVRDGD